MFHTWGRRVFQGAARDVSHATTEVQPASALICAMSTGHGNVDKWPPPAADPPAHSSGEGSDKVAKKKKKKRRRSSSTRGTSGGSAGSLEPNGIAHPQQQHPMTTPASTDTPGGGVPGTASASNGRLSFPVPRSRRNSEDVLGSLKAPGTGGASLPSDTAGSLNHNHGNNDVSFDLHHHHRDNNGDDGQDEGVVIQRDTLSAPDPAHLAAKKGKGKKKKEKDGRRKKQSLAISAVGDEDAPATTTATSAFAGDSTDYSSGGKTERELARSRRKRRDQEAGGSDEPRSGIPYALPTSGRYNSRHKTPGRRVIAVSYSSTGLITTSRCFAIFLNKSFRRRQCG